MPLAAHPNPDASVLSHFSLAGKTALVTGGARGIGLEVSRALAEAGARVAITYTSTSAAEAEAVAASISKANGGVLVKALRCDVRDKAAVARTVDEAVQVLGLGKLDILIANAGIAGHTQATEYTEEEFRGMLDVNFFGAFWAAQAAAKVMKAQVEEGRAPSGSIVFTASVSATLVNVPQPQSVYNASKAGLVHLAKSLAVEWVDFARVNCVSPGYIATDMIAIHPAEWRNKWFSMIPAQRLCEPAELKGIYIFLASNASSYMTGADLIIDGAYSLP